MAVVAAEPSWAQRMALSQTATRAAVPRNPSPAQVMPVTMAPQFRDTQEVPDGVFFSALRPALLVLVHGLAARRDAVRQHLFVPARCRPRLSASKLPAGRSAHEGNDPVVIGIASRTMDVSAPIPISPGPVPNAKSPIITAPLVKLPVPMA